MMEGKDKDMQKGGAGQHIPRILLAAGASGSGKTLITCGILQALTDRGLNVVSCKCGPDYIDPMFHATVLGTKSRNLDTFFTDADTTRYLFARCAKGADIAVMEGVMGYYDGLGGISDRASAYDLAKTTGTPVVLIVNCKGMSLSVIPYIKGFLEYRKDSHIRGVILNRISPMLYPRLADLIRQEIGIVPLGFVPESADVPLRSRHLGLVLPGEIDGIRQSLRDFASKLEESLDLDGLIALAAAAPDLTAAEPANVRDALRRASCFSKETLKEAREGHRPVIAVAKDEAFCFLYEDNLQILRDMGASIRFFSPMRDQHLPPCDGIILPGGYPELHMEELGNNESMRREIAQAVLERKVPCMAECGGFMYLQREMEDMDGRSYPAAGVLDGRAFRTEKLTRFGYIEMTPNEGNAPADQEDAGPDRLLLPRDMSGAVRAHEFHYFDTTRNGDFFHAAKPLGKRGWDCMYVTENLAAGFPHLYYYSNPEVPLHFFRACCRYAAGADEKRETVPVREKDGGEARPQENRR